ncbi:hypothetical protein EDF46_3373 [Frondihabitans sp. PhB188]|nr:hypothetical protein EDF46_3373 [Frondihabitans sp. PhB188]
MTKESGDQEAAWNRINLDVIRNTTDAAVLLAPMGDTMDSTSYWGEHHGDANLRTEQERRALTKIIEAVLASPAMDWWSMPFEPLSQFLVANEHAWCGFEAPPTTGAADRLAQWRWQVDRANKTGVPKKNAAQEAGGEWWSTPLFQSVISTRPLGELPALEIEITEDRFSTRTSRIFHIMPTPTPRVREIDGPDDWVDLVETYPFDVTGQKRGTWWQTTRIDDSWFIPDWAAVAADFDVVHLTGMGYLTTAGRPLAVEGGHTLMAGFSPDESFWLTDSFHFPEPGIDWEPIPSEK